MKNSIFLPFLMIPFLNFAQEDIDSLMIYTPRDIIHIEQVSALGALDLGDVLNYNEMEGVLLYSDSLNNSVHLAWREETWNATDLSEFLDDPSSSLDDIYFSDLNADGENEMIALFSTMTGRSGWQSGFYEQSTIALVWDFAQRQCMGVIPVDYAYEYWWVVNSEVFDEENLHLWEGEDEPELEYDGENIQSWMDLQVKNGEIILSPTPIDCSVPEDSYTKYSQFTYHIFWDNDSQSLRYWMEDQ